MIFQEKKFVLHVMGLDQELFDREQQVHCLRIAVNADIAPKCYYADAMAGIVIMGYIKPQEKDNESTWLNNVAMALRCLYALPIFPPMHQTLFGGMDGLIKKVQVYSLSPILKNYLN